MRHREWIIAIFVIALAPIASRAAETITALDVTVTTRVDDSADVVERIDIVSEGNEIKHGIFRYLPVLVPSGLEVISTDLTVDSVVRDGTPETYVVEDPGQGIRRITMGKADALLPVGPHSYEIHYSVSRAVARLVDQQMLLWSIGGWAFPVEKATIALNMTDTARISRISATVAGRPLDAAQVERPSDHQVILHLPQPLAPNQQFTATVFSITPAGASPTPARHLLRVVAGPAQSCALAEGGALYCWDLLREDGAVIKETSLMDLPALTDFDLGDNGRGCGIEGSGKLLCWTASTQPTAVGVRPTSQKVLTADARFVKVTVGFAHFCALDDAGAVWCGGGNADGELGTGDTVNHPDEMLKVGGLGKAIDVSAGVNNTCAVLQSGEVWCWGTDSPMTSAKLLFESLVPIRIDKLTGLSAVHNGRNFMCGLEAAAVDCWGSNIMGQLGVTSDILGGRIGGLVKLPSGPPTSIGAGMFGACGTFEEGITLCWGSWHENTIFTPRPVVGLPAAKAVSVNSDKACVLTVNEEVWCWGSRPTERHDQLLKTAYTVTPWQVLIPSR